MDTAAKQRAHYAAVRHRLTNPPNAFGFDPEAPYLRANRKLHPVLDNQLGDPPVELAPHEVHRREHKIRTKALLHKTRQQAKRTQEAARKQRSEITRTYDEWEAHDAQQARAVGDNRHDGPDASCHDASAGDATAAKGFAPKASAQGFKEWLAQQRAKQDPANHDASARFDDKTTAQGNATAAGEAEQAVTTLPPLEYVQQIYDASDASCDSKKRE